MIEFDDHIIQMGWNHQLDEDLFFFGMKFMKLCMANLVQPKNHWKTKQRFEQQN